MPRVKNHSCAADKSAATGPQPVSLAEYIRISQESCRHGQCCRDQSALVRAYQQYVNDPQAPWNKIRRSRRSKR
jgi:hypothetical protein